MQTVRKSEKRRASEEQRKFARVAVALSGKLFIPAEDTTVDCEILNLSGAGAGIHCEEPPPLQAYIILYIDGIGRFEGVATRYVDGELGLRYVCTEAKRQRLLKSIAHFVDQGLVTPTRLRRHLREPSVSEGYFKRANMDFVSCSIIDISLQGLSLITDVRPPLGEIIHMGKTCGRVVRHHDDGIAVHFLNTVEADSHGC